MPQRFLATVLATAILLSACGVSPIPSSPPIEEESQAPLPLPRSASIEVPFGAQAPFANWGDPYQEACEEAALIMVAAFLKGETLNPQRMDEEILTLVAWETEHGYEQDVTIEELAQIARDYYGLKADLIETVSVESIRGEIAEGNPVIVPAAGRMLGNPYFSGAGPFYHMLVVTGYTPLLFVTNDPGTKRGEGYTYRNQVLLDAVHDWTGVKEETHLGKKVMLVLSN